ncbi:hypothetical protein EV360DRAFT_52857 [Lentinula raphanica]|nr:hypothetical protein EV360DRAFT_52857 [Lentinula raphanica]
MSDQTYQRFYASEQYLLPADQMETRRLNAQHKMITTLFDGMLSMAPTNLTSGDRVLESAAGTGIWALEFFEKNRADGVILAIDCIDISSAQFPANHPPQLHFSVNSVADLPNPEWSNTFTYVHERLLTFAMNDSLWRSAVSELFRVIKPGGWVELVEMNVDLSGWSVGPNSTKLIAFSDAAFGAKGVIKDLSVYLPRILKEAGFVDVNCKPRGILMGEELELGGEATDEFRTDAGTYSFSKMWRQGYMGMKGRAVESGGFGIFTTVREYEALVEASAREWSDSKEAYVTFHTILAQKPMP